MRIGFVSHGLPQQSRRRNHRSACAMKRRREGNGRENDESLNGRASIPQPRINTSSSTLSLREQLALAKETAVQSNMVDAGNSATTKPRVRTKFRRKKTGFDGVAEGDDRRLQETRARKKVAREEEDVLPDGKFEVNLMDPIALIDAYNVVGAWPKLRKFRNKGDMDSARDALCHDVLEFASVRGWECVIVFDAQGTAESSRLETTGQGVDIVYTGTKTADAFIERRVFELCEQGERQVWVVTNDMAERQFAEAKGAHVMSASLFLQELKQAQSDTAEHTLALRNDSSRANRMLIRMVDSDTRDKLYRLRDALDRGDLSYS